MTYEQQLQWLIKMASNPASKEYAWKRAQELDAEASGLFAGIAPALVKAMKQPPQIVKPQI